MTTKFISLATGIVLLDVYLQSQLSSGDPLFLFASDNLFVNVGLLLVAALMVSISFKGKFKKWWSYVGVAALALTLGLVGLVGAFFSDTFYWFPQFLLPLDYLFLIEAGVVFGICALTYQHQAVPFKLNMSWPKATFNRFAFPVPKILHPPIGFNRKLGST